MLLFVSPGGAAVSVGVSIVPMTVPLPFSDGMRGVLIYGICAQLEQRKRYVCVDVHGEFLCEGL